MKRPSSARPAQSSDRVTDTLNDTGAAAVECRCGAPIPKAHPEMPKLAKRDVLTCIERAADVFASECNPLNPYGTATWIRHFIEQVVPEDGHVHCVDADLGQAGRGLLLLAPDAQHARRGGALANFYTSLYAPFASNSPDRAAAARRLIEELARERPRLSMLNLAPLDAASPDVAALDAALGGAGWHVRRYESFGNCYLPCAGLDFGTYMEGRDSKLRNTFERKAKKLVKSGSVEIVTSVADVDRAMSAYEAIYAKSWKQPEPFAHFTRGWAMACAAQGWLRMGVAYLGDVPIAAQLWYVYRDRAYIYKLAYDEEHAKWSAGTVLTAQLMQHVLDVDHVVEVDFLSGADPYKMTWMTEQRQRMGLVACNLRTVEGTLLAAKEFAGQATAGLRKRRQETPAWSRVRG